MEGSIDSNEAPLPVTYDCIVVGGGPAGLTCAIFLGRYRRRVAVVDAGEPRNKASHGIHGFLGHHSIKADELLRRGREEAEAVGVEIRRGKATAARKSDDVFEVVVEGGETLRGRRLVLAYGVRDEMPDLPDLERFYGSSIFHCPDCDGYEVSDRCVGVVSSGKKAAALALKLLLWTSDITIFTNGEPWDVDEENAAKLEAQGIRVVTGKITALSGEGPQLRAVEAEGATTALDAIFFAIGVSRSSDLAEQLGCEVFEDLPNIRVDEYKETTVEGVWAVGDLVPGTQLVITSAADGAIAAVAVNKTLMPPGQKV
jgi:thioredoxin reductase